jgi:hypothetical protein
LNAFACRLHVCRCPRRRGLPPFDLVYTGIGIDTTGPHDAQLPAPQHNRINGLAAAGIALPRRAGARRTAA